MRFVQSQNAPALPVLLGSIAARSGPWRAAVQVIIPATYHNNVIPALSDGTHFARPAGGMLRKQPMA
jgi:hypothetical protein